MLENKSQNLGHLPVADGALEELVLKAPEALRQLKERGTPLRRAPGLRWITAR